MEVKEPSQPVLCSECRFEIPDFARRCGHCGVIQNPWQRNLLRWGGLLSVFVLIIPVWQIALSFSEFLSSSAKINFRAKVVDCGPKRASFEIRNLEADRSIRVSDVVLTSISRGIQDRKDFDLPLHNGAFALSGEEIAIPFESRAMDFGISDTVHSVLQAACGAQCRYWFQVSATDLEARNGSSTLAYCDYRSGEN